MDKYVHPNMMQFIDKYVNVSQYCVCVCMYNFMHNHDDLCI